MTGEEKNQIYSQKNPAGALVEFLLDRCARGHAPTEMGTVPKNRFVTLGQYLLHQHPELGIGPNEIKEVYYDRK
ncbi:hypothetical protein FWC31_01685 [Candidatus Saccharibacteria bacterium]|nr:hypothetical protein [Candidatus Saccharibacteria bacterium]